MTFKSLNSIALAIGLSAAVFGSGIGGARASDAFHAVDTFPIDHYGNRIEGTGFRSMFLFGDGKSPLTCSTRPDGFGGIRTICY